VYVRIDTSEVHALAADLRGAGRYVEERAPLVVSKVGHDMLATSQLATPVDTGHLRSSEGVEVIGLGFDVYATAEYAEYVELGTSRMNAEPYMGPAFDQHLPNLERALGALGEQAVTGV
jgi:HK97 gp10 family phage protein